MYVFFKILYIYEHLVNFEVFIVFPGALEIHQHFSGLEVLGIKQNNQTEYTSYN
jgi:hypothetical protein